MTRAREWPRDRAYFDAYKRAERNALHHVRTQHPELWERLLDEAFSDRGVIRRKPGRPKKEQQP